MIILHTFKMRVDINTLLLAQSKISQRKIFRYLLSLQTLDIPKKKQKRLGLGLVKN